MELCMQGTEIFKGKDSLHSIYPGNVQLLKTEVLVLILSKSVSILEEINRFLKIVQLWALAPPFWFLNLIFQFLKVHYKSFLMN